MANADPFALKRPHAVLNWTQGGPISELSGDVYFSAENGLEEARSVFLAGAGFPERFNDGLTVVGELGFGTGLNFLALAHLFLRAAKPSSRLHFVSVEGWPLTRADAARALEAFPEVSELARALIEAWPSPHKGAHRRHFADGRITLTLFHDDSADALENMHFKADAWFLDGFAPAKNPDMWTPQLFSQLARLSKPGAPAATFTVAGFVRRGLAEAGFAVEKRPGFGRKRERLEAVYRGEDKALHGEGFAPVQPVSGPVAIIGGGIAAASLVHAFRQRGQTVTVFAEGGWSAGASGAPLGLLTPRLEAADRAHNRALLAAFDYAAQLYKSRGWLIGDGVLRCADNSQGEARLRGLGDLLDDRFEWLDKSACETKLAASAKAGLWMSGGGYFKPADIVAGLADDYSVVDVKVSGLIKAEDGWHVQTRDSQGAGPFATVIVAGGHQGGGLGPVELEATAGRVAGFATKVNLDAAVAWGGYAAPLGPDEVLVGATHVKSTDPGDPERAEQELRRGVEDGPVRLELGARTRHWGGVRAAVADRLPLCGASPDERFAERWRTHARRGSAPDGSAEGLGGPIVLGAFGARGFAHAPLLAEQIVSALHGEPFALEQVGLQALHPARFAWRKLKRGG
jgi:tRNA 5-methylaminomethyl-2-thiouridine biosynthesis bifunctional protein